MMFNRSDLKNSNNSGSTVAAEGWLGRFSVRYSC